MKPTVPTSRYTVLLLAFAVFAQTSTSVHAEGTIIKNICRVKGQEENTLRGLGLVVGLNGTGDAGDEATMRALARALEQMGQRLGDVGLPSKDELEHLRKVKNVALVMVTATVPGTGARRGTKVDCSIAGLTGKSLQGGRLVLAALQSPNTKDVRVYALAQGPIHLEDPAQPLAGIVYGGAQIEQDILNPFHLDGYVTLVLRPSHADFETASKIAQQIGEQIEELMGEQILEQSEKEGTPIAKALDAANIVLRIPPAYHNSEAEFVAWVLEQKTYVARPEARVVVNERTGSIVVSGDVEIGAILISHKNLVIEAGAEGAGGRFVKVDPGNTNPTKLDALLEALNALKVPPKDVITIIKQIDRVGKLHGRLITE